MRKAVCILLLAVCSFVWAQDAHPVTGRKYAGVMGAGGAGRLVHPERESEEQPDAALWTSCGAATARCTRNCRGMRRSLGAFVAKPDGTFAVDFTKIKAVRDLTRPADA